MIVQNNNGYKPCDIKAYILLKHGNIKRFNDEYGHKKLNLTGANLSYVNLRNVK